jgi:Spy/CpxP family protein refolding chaperone
MIASARQRARRAFHLLSLTAAQEEDARRLLGDDRRLLEATRELLGECRARLREVLAARAPDSALVLELTVEERLLVERERATSARLEGAMATLLRPEQAARLSRLTPAAVGDMLGRICG